MTSKFTSRSAPGYWPPWCYDAPTARTPDYIDDDPSVLIAAVLFRTRLSDVDYHASESFSCVFNKDAREYFGESLNAGVRVELEIQAQPAHHRYRPALTLWDGDAYLTGVRWHWLEIAPGPPFDSGFLVKHIGEPGAIQQIRLLA